MKEQTEERTGESKKEKRKVISIYEEARKRTFETGIFHHVDHIKPVSKGGTNHPNNLSFIIFFC